jgi:hypothetical protein
MCTDLGYFSKYNIYKSYPEVTKECVYSQAKVLIPTIKLAGANVVKLFIPELLVKITSLDSKGNVSGIIIHTPNEEYPKTISYSGPVEIKDSNGKVLAIIIAENGRFSGVIKKLKTQVYAEIEFGGVSVFSEKVSPSLKDLPMKMFGFQIYKNNKSSEEESLFNYSGNYNAMYERFNISTYDNSFGKEIPCYITLTGNRFFIKQNYKSSSTLSNGRPKAEKEILVEGELNKEKTLLTNLKVKYYHRSTSYSITTKSFVHLKNIPIKENGRFNFRVFSSDLAPNKALNLIESLSQECIFNYPGEPSYSISMSKNDLINNFSWDLWIDFAPNKTKELFK